MDALERHLPFVSIAKASSFDEIQNKYEYSISLILVDVSLIDEVEFHRAYIAKNHPLAVMAAFHSDKLPPDHAVNKLSSRAIRGIVPMTTKLDIWLSIVTILLRGGEYFPRASIEATDSVTVVLNSHTSIKQIKRSEPVKNSISQLTNREFEVLKLVSKGFQNKIIASSLDLSENTVKIHVHNIITKLGAHNRTGAASILRDSEVVRMQ